MTNVLDSLTQQRAMTSLGIGAGRRAEKGDGLAGMAAASELVEQVRLSANLFEVSFAVFVPADGRASLAVVVGVKGAARTELRIPSAPAFVLLADSTRAVSANEHPIPI